MKVYMTTDQIIEKYSFLTENMMKNFLFKNLNGFREKCVKKIGRRILIDEELFLQFINDCPSEMKNWQGKKNQSEKIENEKVNEKVSQLIELCRNINCKLEKHDVILNMLLGELKSK
jgi:hypothetical protein